MFVKIFKEIKNTAIIWSKKALSINIHSVDENDLPTMENTYGVLASGGVDYVVVQINPNGMIPTFGGNISGGYLHAMIPLKYGDVAVIKDSGEVDSDDPGDLKYIFATETEGGNIQFTVEPPGLVGNGVRIVNDMALRRIYSE